MLDKKQLLNKVKEPDEKLLFSKALDQAFLCAYKYMNTFTGFLDPLKSEKFVALIAGGMDVNARAFGGTEGCERKILGFSPEYAELKDSDFPIEAVEIGFGAKYGGGLTHRDFLGALIGLGIERDRIGDIFIFDQRAVVFLAAGVAGFACEYLDKIGRVGVKAAIKDSAYVYPPLAGETAHFISVQSLRLDSVLSGIFKLPRAKATQLVSGGKAFVNWASVLSPSKPVCEGDNITLRGYGRAVVVEITGTTKSDRIMVKVNVFH